jgi:hypothetical protein
VRQCEARRCGRCPCHRPETFSGIGPQVAQQGDNPWRVGGSARQEISTAVGNGRRPEAGQSLLCEVGKGLCSQGEDAASTRDSPLCVKAINPTKRPIIPGTACSEARHHDGNEHQTHSPYPPSWPETPREAKGRHQDRHKSATKIERTFSRALSSKCNFSPIVVPARGQGDCVDRQARCPAIIAPTWCLAQAGAEARTQPLRGDSGFHS